MRDERFKNLSTEELADVWYALGGAETRHPGAFSDLTDATMRELNARLDSNLSTFLEQRYREFRLADSKEDADATAKAASAPPSLATPVMQNR